MTTASSTPPPARIEYPSCDGKPMSDNTKQARWITVLYGNLLALYRDRKDVFVAADNLWYPVENRPDLRNAPDVYVVFGKWTDLPDRDSLTAIVVERDRAGVLPGRVESKLGHRGSSTTEVQLDNVRVPAENMVGAPGEGWKLTPSA